MDRPEFTNIPKCIYHETKIHYAKKCLGCYHQFQPTSNTLEYAPAWYLCNDCFMRLENKAKDVKPCFCPLDKREWRWNGSTCTVCYNAKHLIKDLYKEFINAALEKEKVAIEKHINNQ